MFTGIITAVGRVEKVESLGQGAGFGVRVTASVPAVYAGYLDDVGLGDSIAMQGACMTVTQLDKAQNQFVVEVSAESLDKTRGYALGERINLEKALRAHDRLGGHIVSGHVDGVGRVEQFESIGESWHLAIQIPPNLARYVAIKGSITINGVSLTINHLDDDFVNKMHHGHLNLIPHTLAQTTLQYLKVGDPINLEIDLIARYLERLQFFEKNA